MSLRFILQSNEPSIRAGQTGRPGSIGPIQPSPRLIDEIPFCVNVNLRGPIVKEDVCKAIVRIEDGLIT